MSLELLLVSPVGERSIIFGRLCGLWIQFLPAAALLMGIWLYLWQVFPHGRDQAAMLLFLSSLLSLPAIGLYFSLRCRNSLSAFLLTLAVGLLAPLSVPGLLEPLSDFFTRNPGRVEFLNMPSSILAMPLQLALAAFCWERLHSRLKHRAFALERIGT